MIVSRLFTFGIAAFALLLSSAIGAQEEYSRWQVYNRYEYAGCGIYPTLTGEKAEKRDRSAYPSEFFEVIPLQADQEVFSSPQFRQTRADDGQAFAFITVTDPLQKIELGDVLVFSSALEEQPQDLVKITKGIQSVSIVVLNEGELSLRGDIEGKLSDRIDQLPAFHILRLGPFNDPREFEKLGLIKEWLSSPESGWPKLNAYRQRRSYMLHTLNESILATGASFANAPNFPASFFWNGELAGKYFRTVFIEGLTLLGYFNRLEAQGKKNYSTPQEVWREFEPTIQNSTVTNYFGSTEDELRDQFNVLASLSRDSRMNALASMKNPNFKIREQNGEVQEALVNDEPFSESESLRPSDYFFSIYHPGGLYYAGTYLPPQKK